MNDQMQKLLDREEIRNLRTLYSHFLDGNHLHRLEEIFAHDAIVEVTVGTMHGIDQIRSGLADAFRIFDRDGRHHFPFLHAIANHVVTLTDPDTAKGQCYLLDFETASKADPNPLLLLGLYLDEYRKIEGSWRITRSRLEVVWPPNPPKDQARPTGANAEGF
jgi:hypothetical protein